MKEILEGSFKENEINPVEDTNKYNTKSGRNKRILIEKVDLDEK